jgi:hypothetical protein
LRDVACTCFTTDFSVAEAGRDFQFIDSEPIPSSLRDVLKGFMERVAQKVLAANTTSDHFCLYFPPNYPNAVIVIPVRVASSQTNRPTVRLFAFVLSALPRSVESFTAILGRLREAAEQQATKLGFETESGRARIQAQLRNNEIFRNAGAIDLIGIDMAPIPTHGRAKLTADRGLRVSLGRREDIQALWWAVTTLKLTLANHACFHPLNVDIVWSPGESIACLGPGDERSPELVSDSWAAAWNRRLSDHLKADVHPPSTSTKAVPRIREHPWSPKRERQTALLVVIVSVLLTYYVRSLGLLLSWWTVAGIVGSGYLLRLFLIRRRAATEQRRSAEICGDRNSQAEPDSTAATERTSPRKHFTWTLLAILLIALTVLYLLRPLAHNWYVRRRPSPSDLPRIARTANMPDQSLNIALTGAEAELTRIMLSAEWQPADLIDPRSQIFALDQNTQLPGSTKDHLTATRGAPRRTDESLDSFSRAVTSGR